MNTGGVKKESRNFTKGTKDHRIKTYFEQVYYGF